jgi:ATP-dependent DNA helicase RecG
MNDAVRNQAEKPTMSPSERLRAASLLGRKQWRAPVVTVPQVSPRMPEAVSTTVVVPAKAFLATPGLSQRPSSKPQVDLFRPEKLIKAAPKARATTPKLDPQIKALKSLALPNLQHMLLCVPSGFSDCRYPIDRLAGLVEGYRGLFLLRRTGHVEALDHKNRPVSAHPHASIFDAPYPGYWSRIGQLKVELEDVNGNTVWLSVFGAWRLKDKDPLGTMLIEGELKQFGSKRYITSATEPPADVAGKVWVRYVCPGAPSEADVRSMVHAALQDPASIDTAVHSLVSTSLLSEAQLLDIAENACGIRYETLNQFIRTLHEPESPDEGELAASAARSMAVAGICCSAKVANTRYPHPKAALNLVPAVIEQLIQSQAETLTSDQATVVQGLVTALRSPNPLNGLLSGDVGTGKTLAFMIPAVAAYLSGAQVAIISPTDILANQVAANLMRRFPQVNVERVFAGKKIKNPQAILIGTSGLGSVAKKCGYTPNFLIVDEQHKLATRDRNAMVGAWTHQLEASATPIPRSLANTLFSGTQVFNLNQAPVERKIESFVFDEADRGQVGAWMREVIDGGQRVAIIYPRVEKAAEKLEAMPALDGEVVSLNATDSPVVVSSVNAAAEALETRFPGLVGKLHGKMASEDVAQTLQSFREGTLRLAVASTIFETGIDIPDIRLLIVKDAHNFGVAQLHQLRGRLARNGGSARFVMMVTDQSALAPETALRLQTVSETTDGYALAEADMQTRGFGDLSGNAQSGNINCAFRLLRLTLEDFSA